MKYFVQSRNTKIAHLVNPKETPGPKWTLCNRLVTEEEDDLPVGYRVCHRCEGVAKRWLQNIDTLLEKITLG